MDDPRRNEIQELVGWNLRRLRTKLGLSQEALAGEAEMDTAHVSRIERGIENPTVYVLHRLADALGAKHAEFFKAVPAGAKKAPKLKPGPKSK